MKNHGTMHTTSCLQPNRRQTFLFGLVAYPDLRALKREVGKVSPFPMLKPASCSFEKDPAIDVAETGGSGGRRQGEFCAMIRTWDPIFDVSRFGRPTLVSNQLIQRNHNTIIRVAPFIIAPNLAFTRFGRPTFISDRLIKRNIITIIRIALFVFSCLWSLYALHIPLRVCRVPARWYLEYQTAITFLGTPLAKLKVLGM